MMNEIYLNALDGGQDKEKIKVLTGIRGSGKSFLLRAIACNLKEQYADSGNIIYIDFGNFISPRIESTVQLKKYILNKINTGKTASGSGTGDVKESGRLYVFLDEIQRLYGWEKALTDILDNTSGRKPEFFTALPCYDSGVSGKKQFFKNRYTEFKLGTLSFKEYQNEYFKNRRMNIQDRKNGLLRRAMELRTAEDNIFARYFYYGGFPDSVFCHDVYKNKAMLNNIFSSIMYNDVILKNNVRYPELLHELLSYIFENIGTEHSAKKLTEYLSHFMSKKHIAASNAKKYLHYLERAAILTKVLKVNLRTGKVINTHAIYYLKEHSLIYVYSDINNYPVRPIYENILVNELERRYYNVYSAQCSGYNIDFASKKNNLVLLIQTVSAQYDSDRDIENKAEELLREDIDTNGNTVLRYIVIFDRRHGTHGRQYRFNCAKIQTSLLPEFLLADSY